MATSNWVGGGDIRVTAEGQQTAPATAALAGGGWVIAWIVSGTSAAGDFSEVHAQRFDAAGAKIGGELLLSQGPAYGVPALAAVADGGFVAAWDTRADPLASTNYLVRRFDASGNPLADAVQANLASNLDPAASVEATALAGGGFLVDWWMNPGGPTFWGPQLQLYASGGAPIGGDTPLGYEADGTPFGAGTYLHTAAIAPTADGGFVAVWAAASAYEPGAGTTDRIYVQRFDAAGQALAAPAEALAVPSTSVFIDGVETAVLAGSGDVVISTRGTLPDGRMQVTAQRFDSAGHALGAQQAIVFTSAVLDSKVTALAGGDFVVSWLDSQLQGQTPTQQVQTLRAQGFDGQGNLSGSQLLVGSSLAVPAPHFTVTATADGGAVFAWDDGRLDTGDVFAERFTPSGSGDVVAPTAVAFAPADEAVDVPPNWDIVVSFSEAIQRGSGSIVIKDAAGRVFASYDAATSGQLSITGATLAINPATDLALSTSYSVEFAPGSVRDLAGNAYAGTTSYNFRTGGPATGGDTVAPDAIDFFPAPGSTTLPPDWSFGITFSEAVKAGTGTITLQTAAGAVVQTFAAASDPGLHFNGTTVIIDPAANLLPGTTYRLIVAPDAVQDLAGNAYAGESGYSFSTAGAPPGPGPDPTAPAAIDFFPASGSSTLPPDWNLGITFSEAVRAGSGTITLQTAAGAVVQTFAPGDAGLRFNGSSLIIDPAADLQPGTTYRLVVAPDAVQDLDGHAYAGESGYSFSTAGTPPGPGPDTTAPAAIDFFPASGSSTLPPDWNLGITFSESIKAGAGTIMLHTAAGGLVQTFAANDPGLHYSGAVLIIDPAADLLAGTTYRLIVGADAVKDLAGNAYAGESNYMFTTAGSQVAKASLIGAVADPSGFTALV